jgi:enoyl-CoA hydratase/carnithine racemase
MSNESQKFEAEIATSVSGNVATITLTRPDEGNALTRAMMVRLSEHIRTLSARSDVHVVALAAQGDIFCRGRDGRGENRKGMSAYDIRVNLMGAVLGVYEAIAQASVPVVACVQGPATNFGLALATACDITLSSDKASFCFSEIAHGIPATMAMAAAMPNVSPKALAYLIYGAKTIGPEQAMNWGLISDVFAHESFVAQSQAFVASLAAKPRLTLETIKRFQNRAAGLSADMRAEYAGTLLALVRTADGD